MAPERNGTVKVTGTRPDGTTFELEATLVRNLDAAGIRALAQDISGTGRDLAGRRDIDGTDHAISTAPRSPMEAENG